MPLRRLPLLLLLTLHGLNHLAVAPAVDQFTFDGFAGANLSLDGTAAVTPDGLLMLTNGTTLLKGHAFYPSPLQFHGSFSTAFVFGIVSEYADLSSPGLAFVVSKSNDFSKALQSQYMGLANAANNGNASNHLLAIELDTIVNAEFGDMSDNHVGIDVDGLSSVAAENAGYYEDGTGAFRNMSLLSRNAAQVWVDFDARASLVSVTMAPLALPKPKKPLLSATVNLSSVIGDEAYVGFSSSTGVVASRHYVLAWSFKMEGPAPALNISKLPALPFTIPKRPSMTLKILLPIASAALVLALAITILVIDRRRRKYAELKEDWETAFGPHRFSYKDLFHATDGFSDTRLLGVGGFGRVYKGVLPASGLEVAVKKVSHESRQGMKEFIAEVVSIGQIRHRNLVQLLGYCRRKRELLLVYDHMPNGSLDKFLYDPNMPVLSWSRRMGIIKDVASSILYLHEEWEQVVLHRDIKASNVLLDAGMKARLGDFGLARLYDHGTDPHTTRVVGTMGYLAPELGHTGKASKASDVFAFGVFMLEVACGRRPIAQDAHGEHILLADRVLEHWRDGSITDAVDPRLRGDFVVEEASFVLKLCLLCSHPLPDARPGVRRIMQFLEGNTPLPELSEAQLSVGVLALMQNQVACSHSLPSTIAEREDT
ncbi:L-type lectin-domain containing receptor kinase IV.1 [Brachypodium distachyon]|uniref:L-type lectin-domain containing receptor kinase IV.1 n=1 Tax=Brachypodium distachyon TaxID=15368 RepID=UPI00071E0C82|nr:L-type lectin-domain containing receptor kinase IV.1 [Brachypodium distachyon]|eukprot:XP_003572755.2 L-type lectin-domain containing receptor kinase IV.1 [Brachypodium distachyon]